MTVPLFYKNKESLRIRSPDHRCPRTETSHPKGSRRHCASNHAIPVPPIYLNRAILIFRFGDHCHKFGQHTLFIFAIDGVSCSLLDFWTNVLPGKGHNPIPTDMRDTNPKRSLHPHDLSNSVPQKGSCQKTNDCQDYFPHSSSVKVLCSACKRARMHFASLLPQWSNTRRTFGQKDRCNYTKYDRGGM